ncbi:glutaminase [Bacillus alveayuensis]|uniref:glutaminase n=1 Tax=Aeribacillus alveayuensis TaxID=279215 RepID=UPI0005CD0E4A
MDVNLLAVNEKEKNLSYTLQSWVTECKPFAKDGRCATYIPALMDSNPFDLGVCLLDSTGIKLTAGEWEKYFTIQSISKVINFILVCSHLGISTVLDRVDVEPTGDAFNSIIHLELHKPKKPFNPMINPGAITVSSMIPGNSSSEKLELLIQFVEKLIGKRPTINQEVFESEWETAYRNRALAYYLKEIGYLYSDVDIALEVYLKQCAIEMNTVDLALIGLILSLDGFNPITQKQIFDKKIARVTKALMLTCGMYNGSGKFAAFIGMPAKSGVSGGIMATVPPKSLMSKTPLNQGCGIGIYGPAIDDIGNSLAGVMLLKKISQEWELSIFSC